MPARAPRGPSARWWALFLAAFVLCACWTFAQPVLSAPDETAHVRKAEAVVRGQFLGRADTVERSVGNAGQLFFGPYSIVHVPDAIAGTTWVSACYWGKPRQPASCAPSLGTSSRAVAQRTYVGRYPPVYYLLVGWPTLVSPGRGGVYAMRLLSSLWAALFLASGIMSLLRPGRPATAVALLAALPPLVFALSGAVNPSGLEVCTAFALWCALLGLVRPGTSASAPRRLALRAGLAAVALVGLRGLSPLWLAGIVAATLLSGDRQAIARLWARRPVRTWAGVVVAATAAAVAWILAARSYLVLGISVPPATPLGTLVRDAVGRTWTWGGQAVAPWEPNFAPARSVTFLWWLVVLTLIAAAAVVGARHRRVADGARRAIVLGALVVICLVLPVVITVVGDRRYGPGWIGRYLWPFELGGLLLGASLLDDLAAHHRRLRSRWSGFRTGTALARTALVALGAASLVELCLVLRRYTVGTAGPVFFWPGSWQPPVPALALVALATIALAVLVAVLWPGQGREDDQGLSAARSPGRVRADG